MELRACSALSEIGREAWDAAAAPFGNPFVRYDFLHALEASGCVSPENGWTPCHLAGEGAGGLARGSDETRVAVAFGVLTTEDEAQAMARAGGSEGNKGADAALTAVELASLLRKLGG